MIKTKKEKKERIRPLKRLESFSISYASSLTSSAFLFGSGAVNAH